MTTLKLSNTLIREVGRVGGSRFGILDTPCFPARYYAGQFREVPGLGLINGSNETYKFHRTLEAALAAALNEYEYWVDKEKERKG